jgi:hypothetical protein
MRARRGHRSNWLPPDDGVAGSVLGSPAYPTRLTHSGESLRGELTSADTS